jgi:DNA-binding IclR family transcriptional regulator
MSLTAPIEPGGTGSEQHALVKSAERTIRILETLAASPIPLTLSQLQQHLRYPRSSLHALVRTMVELKWVEGDERGLCFGIGPHALLAGTSYLDKDPALTYAQEVMEDLRAEVGHTVHLARRDGAYVIYLASREPRDSVRLIQRVGRRLPAHVTALGQVLLAELTRAELEDLLPTDLEACTPDSITTRAALATELDAVRERGWAFEREQGTPGVACVAAPVAYRIPASDALSCSMPATITDKDRDRAADAVTRHAYRLATVLRHKGIR